MAVLSNNDLTFANGGGYRWTYIGEVTTSQMLSKDIAELKTKYSEIYAICVFHTESNTDYVIDMIIPTIRLKADGKITFQVTRGTSHMLYLGFVGSSSNKIIASMFTPAGESVSGNFTVDLYAR